MDGRLALEGAFPFIFIDPPPRLGAAVRPAPPPPPPPPAAAFVAALWFPDIFAPRIASARNRAADAPGCRAPPPVPRAAVAPAVLPPRPVARLYNRCCSALLTGPAFARALPPRTATGPPPPVGGARPLRIVNGFSLLAAAASNPPRAAAFAVGVGPGTSARSALA
jgi:hypothetical protein|eukprot:31534-Pelagococcus_subviridis.AAC.4